MSTELLLFHLIQLDVSFCSRMAQKNRRIIQIHCVSSLVYFCDQAMFETRQSKSNGLYLYCAFPVLSKYLGVCAGEILCYV